MGEREIREKVAEIEAKLRSEMLITARAARAQADFDYETALKCVREGGEVRVEPQATPPRMTFPWLVE